jgi:hypothetical protein
MAGSKAEVAAARTAADNFKKNNKGKTSPALESELAVQMAQAKADHANRNIDPPRWATNR